MCRYQPSTIYRYLNMPSTQRIQTHNSNRHNITPLVQILFQAFYLTRPTPHTRPHPKLHPLAPHSSIARQLNHVYHLHPCTHDNHNSIPHTNIAVTLALSQHTHMQKTVHASQSPQPTHLHRVPKQPQTDQGPPHRPSH